MTLASKQAERPDDADDLCERLRMALAEVGADASFEWSDGDEVVVSWPSEPEGAVVWLARASDICGIERKCLPCMEADWNYCTPRVSPDCEGTGRCRVES